MASGSILYCGKFTFPDRNAAASRVVTNALLFRQIGLSVEIFGEGQPEQVGEGVAIETRKIMGGFFEYGFLPVTLIGRLFRRGVTGVLIYNYPAIATLFILAAARALRVKMVLELTEWYDPPGNFSLGSIGKRFDVFMRMCIIPRWCDGFIVASEFLREHLGTLGKPVIELPTLYSDLPNISDVSDEVDPVAFNLVYAGNPFYYKNVKIPGSAKERIDLVVRSVMRLNEAGVPVRLQVFGVDLDCFLGFFPEFEEACRGPEVVFRGRSARQDVINAIAGADYTIFFREITRVTLSNYPSKFTESVALGTPVITNAVPGFGKYCNEDVTVLCKDLCVEAIVRKLLEAMDKERVRVMKGACRRIRSQFLAENYRERVGAFVDDVFGSL